MWEMLTIIAAMILSIGIILLFLCIRAGDESVGIYIVAIITLLVIFFTFYAYDQARQEKFDEFKNRCHLENAAVDWNVSSGTITLDVYDVPFTLQVSDFKGMEKRDGENIEYTPSTMSDCFKQNR